MAAPGSVESVNELIQKETEPMKLLEAARKHLKTKKNQDILASELLVGELADVRAKWQRLINSNQKLSETEAQEIYARIPTAFRGLPGGSHQAKQLQSRFAQLAVISEATDGNHQSDFRKTLYGWYLEMRPLEEAQVTGQLYDWSLFGDWSESKLCPSGEMGRDDALTFINIARLTASRWVPDGQLCTAVLEQYLQTLELRPGQHYHLEWESLRDRMQERLGNETYCRLFALTLRYWAYRADSEPDHPGASDRPIYEPSGAEQQLLSSLLGSISNLGAANGQG